MIFTTVRIAPPQTWIFDMAANDHREEDLLSRMAPSGRYVAVVVGSSFTICDALLVGSGGLANLKDSDGNYQIGIPLQTGFNPIRCTGVGSGSVAANIWALRE